MFAEWHKWLATSQIAPIGWTRSQESSITMQALSKQRTWQDLVAKELVVPRRGILLLNQNSVAIYRESDFVGKFIEVCCALIPAAGFSESRTVSLSGTEVTIAWKDGAASVASEALLLVLRLATQACAKMNNDETGRYVAVRGRRK